jgi:N-acetylneuraminate epimerase
MGMQPTDYQWNNKALSYNPTCNQWTELSDNPFLPNCDATTVQTGTNAFTIIGGEIKPGLRTPMIKSLTIVGDECLWQRLSDLRPANPQSVQEGLAGAFAAAFSEKVILAGGVNFKGARENFANGKAFAHQGLEKQWHKDIYLFDGNDWSTIGTLPSGLGYGASFSHNETLFIAGGENKDGVAQSSFFALHLS